MDSFAALHSPRWNFFNSFQPLNSSKFQQANTTSSEDAANEFIRGNSQMNEIGCINHRKVQIMCYGIVVVLWS